MFACTGQAFRSDPRKPVSKAPVSGQACACVRAYDLGIASLRHWSEDCDSIDTRIGMIFPALSISCPYVRPASQSLDMPRDRIAMAAIEIQSNKVGDATTPQEILRVKTERR
jgi:hypothetical protein